MKKLLSALLTISLFLIPGLLLLSSCSQTSGTQDSRESAKPNVILIMADDLGYSGTTAFGGIGLHTPALDRLATEGVVCTDYHANAPVCSPTRVSIMTGRYQQRAGLNHIYSESNPNSGLDPATHPSFVRQLQEAGYRTAVYGKWHMGMDEKYNPVNHGFDDFRGFLKGNVDFISHINTTPEEDWMHNLEKANEPGYATDLINRYAVEFVQSCEGEPFFLYLPHAAIHTPIQGRHDAPIRTDSTYAYDNGAAMDVAEYQRRYREMIQVMDEGVGMLVEELERQGILDNTLLIFVSDNGATNIAKEKFPGANGFFNGFKVTLYEGGIRVPAIFRFPEGMKHRVTDELMMSMDLMPTILEFCGLDVPENIDGVSLLPTLESGEPMPERDVYWSNLSMVAMRDGDWKLVWQKPFSFGPPEGPQEATSELFNLMIDPKEQHDLSAEYPELSESMKIRAEEWWEDVTRGTELDTVPVLEYQFKF
ncbi:MAG: sulfatase-like hydrolase/transferase [Bacteroidales bacterium]